MAWPITEVIILQVQTNKRVGHIFRDMMARHRRARRKLIYNMRVSEGLLERVERRTRLGGRSTGL